MTRRAPTGTRGWADEIRPFGDLIEYEEMVRSGDQVSLPPRVVCFCLDTNAKVELETIWTDPAGSDGSKVVRILGAKGNLAGSSHSVGENVLGHTVGLYASAVYLVVPQNNLILTLFQLLGQGAIAYIHFMDIVYLTQSAETSKPTVRRQTTFQVCTIVYIDIFSSSEVAVIGFTYLGITVYSQNFISLTGHKSGGTIVTSLDLTSGTVANKALKEMKPS